MENIDRLVESLARDPAVVRLARPPFRLAGVWLAGAGVYLVLALALTGLRPDEGAKLHEPWFLLEIVFLGGILLATSLSASLLTFPDLYQKRRIAFSPAILFLLFACIIAFSWHADNPPAPLPLHSYQCTLSIVLVALPPAAWIFYGMRHAASTHCRLAGSTALLYAFSVGALWLRLHEQNDSVLHVLQWHYFPMAVTGALGLWLGKVMLKW